MHIAFTLRPIHISERPIFCDILCEEMGLVMELALISCEKGTMRTDRSLQELLVSQPETQMLVHFILNLNRS